MHSAAPSPRPPSPQLEIGKFEVILGSRRLTLDQACTLQAGRLYLVVGPSGSGKSSFARALLGFGTLSDPVTECNAAVTLGNASGGTQPIWNNEIYHPATRARIAFLPQAEKLGFIDALSVSDNLTLFSHL